MKRFIFLFILLFSFSYADDFIPAKVVKIVDGDTLKVIVNSKIEKVRLIGIDTPEIHKNRRAKLQSKKLKTDLSEIIQMGKEAKKFVSSIVKKGEKIFLETDVQERDRYGRILAYVWLKDGSMLNEKIICNGYAMPLTIPPNVKYKDTFLYCFRYAREQNLGLWKSSIHYVCGEKRFCYQMKNCDEAYFYLKNCNLKRLDRDKDGIPCEKLCK